MLSTCEITEIFYLMDEYSKEFNQAMSAHQIREDNGKRHRNKPNRLSDSEVMTILVSFHLSGMRNLKHYYLFYVCKHLQTEFPGLVSYNRYVELQQRILLPLVKGKVIQPFPFICAVCGQSSTMLKRRE